MEDWNSINGTSISGTALLIYIWIHIVFSKDEGFRSENI